jgi:hypothetical protein
MTFLCQLKAHLISCLRSVAKRSKPVKLQVGLVRNWESNNPSAHGGVRSSTDTASAKESYSEPTVSSSDLPGGISDNEESSVGPGLGHWQQGKPSHKQAHAGKYLVGQVLWHLIK